MTKDKKSRSELSNLDASQDDAGLNPETIEGTTTGPATNPIEVEQIEAEALKETIEKDTAKITDDGIPRHAAVLTGGIDSTVMLYLINETLTNRFEKFQIYPIILTGEKDSNLADAKKKIQIHLDRLGINNKINTFKLGPKSNSIEQVLAWCQAQEIGVIDFAATGEEAEANIPGKSIADYQALGDLNPAVQVATPLITIAKKDIIQWAVDRYNIDIGAETTAPYFPKGKIGEANKKLREKGFNSTWSDKFSAWIEDPFKPRPKAKDLEAKAEEKAKVEAAKPE